MAASATLAASVPVVVLPVELPVVVPLDVPVVVVAVEPPVVLPVFVLPLEVPVEPPVVADIVFLYTQLPLGEDWNGKFLLQSFQGLMPSQFWS